MLRRRETDALVIGAGPVGMVAALSLAEHDLRVEIVDEGWQTAARSYALALHPGTLTVLERLGLMDDLVDRGHRITKIAFYEGAERRGTVELSRLAVDHPFVLVLPQSVLEERLAHHLDRRGLTVQWSHRLTELTQEPERVVTRIERLAEAASGYGIASTPEVAGQSLIIAANYVLGTDGHRSAVRRSLGIGLEPVGSPEVHALFELQAAVPAPEEVRVVLDGAGTSVLWPLDDGRCRWSFQLATGAPELERPDKSRLAVQVGRETYPHLDRPLLEYLLGERAPWFTAELGELTWAVAVRFERRLADRFGVGRTWLAGDAAHLGAPIGVHSMNVGIQEAADLAGRVAVALHDGEGDDEGLTAYDRERRREWTGLLGLAGGPTPAPGGSPEGWARSRAPQVLSCLPASGESLIGLLAQLGLGLPAAPSG